MWKIHVEKLAFVGRQAVAGLGMIVGELGKVIAPLAIEAGTFFATWAQTNSKAIGAGFQAGVTGLVQGLLGRPGSFGDLLKEAFGGAGVGDNTAGIKAFFQGVGQGLRDVWAGLTWIGKAALAFLQAVGGSDPEKVGEMLAQLTGLTLAAKVAAGPLGVIKDALVAIGAGLFSIVSAARLAGMLGGAGSAAAGAAGAAGLISLPALLGVAVVGGALAVAIWNWNAIKSWFSGDRGAVASTSEVKEGMAPWLRNLLGLSDPAALGILRPGVSGGSGSSQLGGSAGPRDRLTGQDLGSAVASPIGTATTGNRAMLDAISRAEGTANRPGGGYNTTLGFGRYLPGGQEVNLQGMTLNEVHALGMRMRKNPANPHNSSAVGKYQLLATSTMMDAARALGMDPSTTKFDAATQDRMASWVWSKQGPGAWAGFARNPAELAAARAAAAGRPTIVDPATVTGARAAGGVTGNATAFLQSRSNKGGDAITGLNGDFQTRLAAMFQNAPDGIRDELGIYSGYRSPERQAEIFNAAVRKYGSVAAARKWAAPPGKSMHNVGKAVDLSWRGKSLQHAPAWVKDWVRQNSGAYGMKVPMGHEPWHIEPQETRGGSPFDMSRIPTAKAMAGAVPTASQLSSKVPTPQASPVGMGGAGAGAGGSGAPTISNTFHISGGNQKPDEIAQAVERRLSATRLWSSNDVEYAV